METTIKVEGYFIDDPMWDGKIVLVIITVLLSLACHGSIIIDTTVVTV